MSGLNVEPFGTADAPPPHGQSQDEAQAQHQARSLSVIERAYELARSGACRSVAEITTRLKREHHDSVEAHLAGQSIRRDLRRLCLEFSKAAKEDKTGKG